MIQESQNKTGRFFTMKKWKTAAVWLITLTVLTAGLAFPASADAAEVRKADSSVPVYKEGAVVPAKEAPAVRRAAKEKPCPIIILPAEKRWIKR